MKYLIAALIILAVIFFGVGFYFMEQQPAATTNTPSNQTGNSNTTGSQTNTSSNQQSGNNNTQTTTVTTQPTGQGSTKSSGSGMTVQSLTGQNIQVNDFLHDPATQKDPSNANSYYLSGLFTLSNKNPPYSIEYVTSNQSFTIGLWTEPLKQTRQAAEQDLMSKLGITQQEMCQLRYYVSVPYSISPIYEGKNLGFSFCPGAVNLP
jgi:uncharacterized membrane protein YdfJ with MMPL/SSD domain